MKTKLLFNTGILSTLILFGTCTEHQKREVVVQEPKTAEAAVFELAPSLSMKEVVPKKELPAAAPTNKPTRRKAKINTDPTKSIGKRIPFNEMLKANIAFTENKGQLERFEHFYSPELGKVKFYTKAFSGNAYFGNKGIGFGFQKGGLSEVDAQVNKTDKVKMTKAERREMIGFSIDFVGSNEKVKIIGENEQHTKINYLKGNDPNAFVTDISSFEKVHYKQLYKGIDLIYYNKSNQLKYDYILAPKADVHQIKMSYNKVNHLEINEKGELEIEINWGILVDKKPYAYQLVNGKKKEVKVDYVLLDKETLGFEINGPYDGSKELVIDPFTVAWSTYIGTGTTEDGYIEATCIDNTGRTLGTGWCNNAFPFSASPNGYDKSYNGGTDAYVFRLNANATALDYVTFLGGSGNETGTGVLINSAGDICVSGHTSSFKQSAFVENIAQTIALATGTVTIAVINNAAYGIPSEIEIVNGANSMIGTIISSPNSTTLIVTFSQINGTGTFSNWAVNRLPNTPFPTTSNAIRTTKAGLDGTDDIFYVKLNGSGNNLIYGTHYGGTDSNVDWAIDMALDPSNNAYIVGRTQSNTSFSTTGVYKTASQGGYDGYVLKINSDGTLGYCTFIGGASNDITKGIDVNSAGEVFVTGMTASSGMGTVGTFQPNYAGNDDAFLLKLNSNGTLSFFTYFGGASGRDCGSDIDLIQSKNEAVIVGTAGSSDFPLQNPIDNVFAAEEGFVARFNSTGSAISYSTFVGGDGGDNVKGNDYTQIAKNGGVKMSSTNLPILIFAMASSAASMSTFLVSPPVFTAVNQAGANYTFDGGSYSGGGIGDFFVTVLDSTAQTALFGSYFGGSDNDYPTAGINILQSTGCVVFGGGVHSLPFPVTPGVVQTIRNNSTGPDEPAIVKVCLPEILPVELLDFRIKEINGNAIVDWRTATEHNNSYFEILKSTNGHQFYSIGRVEGNGSRSTVSDYQFVDKKISAGTTYYRLKQVDYNGQSQFTTIRSISILNLAEFSLVPNPGYGIVRAETILKTDCYIEITVTNDMGQQVFSSAENVSRGPYEKGIDLSGQASGMYFIQITADEQSKVVKYIKQ